MEELTTLKQDLKSMENRLTEMEDKIDSIDGKLTQVVDAILGNPLTKQGGFITEIENLNKQITYLKVTIQVLEDKQRKTDKFKDRVIWALIIIGILAGVIKFITTVYANLSV